MSKSIFECKQLAKYYSHRLIFGNLNFSVSSGSSLGILGRNGSGKSTLIKIISGLISPTKGDFLFSIDGKEIKREEYYKYIGFMSPYLNLYDELSGFENLEFFLNLKQRDIAKNDKEEKINTLLEDIGLFKARKELYKNYSSGMKQRLKLAFALLNDPELLLLDEPCSNLDKEGIDIVYKYAEKQKQSKMLIIATNEESDLKLCDATVNIEEFKNSKF